MQWWLTRIWRRDVIPPSLVVRADLLMASHLPAGHATPRTSFFGFADLFVPGKALPARTTTPEGSFLGGVGATGIVARKTMDGEVRPAAIEFSSKRSALRDPKTYIAESLR